jgi:predicted DNA-binding antitoxin AbrB/MazE fold protein
MSLDEIKSLDGVAKVRTKISLNDGKERRILKIEISFKEEDTDKFETVRQKACDFLDDYEIYDEVEIEEI